MIFEQIINGRFDEVGSEGDSEQTAFIGQVRRIWREQKKVLSSHLHVPSSQS